MEGVAPDAEKIEAVHSWPTLKFPRNSEGSWNSHTIIVNLFKCVLKLKGLQLVIKKKHMSGMRKQP